MSGGSRPAETGFPHLLPLCCGFEPLIPDFSSKSGIPVWNSLAGKD
jgi:hypothetical protein